MIYDKEILTQVLGPLVRVENTEDGQVDLHIDLGGDCDCPDCEDGINDWDNHCECFWHGKAASVTLSHEMVDALIEALQAAKAAGPRFKEGSTPAPQP